ncbi:MAG TPA: hypothetical protein VFL57_11330 [Bryobacteraceae bacterium]|nr:hypothetical protein [Bryobacteraceae bacterium]
MHPPTALGTFTLAALLSAVAPACFGAIVAFPPSEDQVPEWVQSPDAVTLIGTGFLGQRFVRLQAGGSLATYLNPSALGNAVYGMTAAFAIFAPSSSWTLEVFAGGTPEAGTTTPAGSTLLVSASGTLATVSTEDAPVWTARGTGYSSLSLTPPAGTPIWLRVRAVGGALGVDSVLGVENADWSIWFPGDPPTRISSTNWDFELPAAGDVSEPLTFALVGPALLALVAARRRA